jgi:hypothetical protein
MGGDKYKQAGQSAHLANYIAHSFGWRTACRDMVSAVVDLSSGVTMQSSHHDLSMSSYVLLGLLAIGHEALGIRTALILVLGLVAVWVALSLLVALVAQLRKTQSTATLPPK